MNDRLKLVSASKDVKLSGIQCVVHGTANEAAAQQILGMGFPYMRGRPSVSTNLAHALEGESGRVVIMRVPPGAHVGYGVFTSAYIDRRIKRVGGAPLRYAAARKQLAMYATPDVDAGRQLIEDTIMAGAEWGSQPVYTIDPGEVLATLKPSDATVAIISGLAASATDFSAVKAGVLAGYLASEAQLCSGTPEELTRVLEGLVIGTVESIVISRLRMMRWQGLKGIGYEVYEGQSEAASIVPREPREQLRQIEATEQHLASSTMLDGELSWLKPYATNALAVMRLELEGSDI